MFVRGKAAGGGYRTSIWAGATLSALSGAIHPPYTRPGCHRLQLRFPAMCELAAAPLRFSPSLSCPLLRFFPPTLWQRNPTSSNSGLALAQQPATAHTSAQSPNLSVLCSPPTESTLPLDPLPGLPTRGGKNMNGLPPLPSPPPSPSPSPSPTATRPADCLPGQLPVGLSQLLSQTSAHHIHTLFLISPHAKGRELCNDYSLGSHALEGPDGQHRKRKPDCGRPQVVSASPSPLFPVQPPHPSLPPPCPVAEAWSQPFSAATCSFSRSLIR